MATFHNTIPVVDMRDWTEGDHARQQNFAAKVREALHEVGFFAVTNCDIDHDAIDKGYETMQKFFTSPIEKKDECHIPKIAGLRGYVHSETAQGQSVKDHKEHYHIGPIGEGAVTEAGGVPNVFPSWMDMEGPMKGLLDNMDKSRRHLEEAVSVAMGEEKDYLTSITTGGSQLLRALHYPSNPSPGQYWGAPHTDINMLTMLPKATEEGLQVLLPASIASTLPEEAKAKVEYTSDKDSEGQEGGIWLPVQVPPRSLIINGGDELQALSNGYFRSSVHRIVSKPNVERYSMVYFIHPRNEVSVAPRDQFREGTSAAKDEKHLRFPDDVTAWDMLHHRLMELGLAPVVPGAEHKYATAVESLIAAQKEGGKPNGYSCDPHPAVQKTWSLWQTVKNRKPASKQIDTAEQESKL